MKKLMSIGVALALLTMAVVPAAVAAYDYDEPDTYAKVPFAIVQSGFDLLSEILPVLLDEFAPDYDWLATLMGPIGEWAGGPLSWTVDMLAWGLDLGGGVVTALAPTLGLPDWIGDTLTDVSCGLITCWNLENCDGEFTPCAP